MKHKVKVTVLDKKLYPELQQQYLADPELSLIHIFIDQKERIVLKSHALGIENYSLRFLEQALEIPVYFENDANAADVYKRQVPERYESILSALKNGTPIRLNIIKLPEKNQGKN